MNRAEIEALLTPEDSAFNTDDLFKWIAERNDALRFLLPLAYVEDVAVELPWKDEAARMAADYQSCKRRAEALQSRLAAMTEALKPFAEEAKKWSPTNGWSKDDTMLDTCRIADPYCGLSVGDLRKARAALKDTKGE